MVKASICTIGDEILIGQIVDTNSAEIARALGSAGIGIAKMVSIGDNHDEIVSCLAKELKDSEVVVVTGGLGPTKDDITKEALSQLSGSKAYVNNEKQAEVVVKLLHARGLEVLDLNKAQSMVPETCEVIVNKVGTAPVMVFRMDPSLYGHPTTLYSMPGVPFETKNALPDVLEDIRSHHKLDSIVHKNVMTYGIAESALAKKLSSWEEGLPKDMRLAYLPDPLKGVKLRLSVYGGHSAGQEMRIDREFSKLGGIIGENIYSWKEDSLEHALGEFMKSKGLRLSCAESCTGGEIAHLITSVPGSSEYFLGSVTSYAVSVKESVLGVPGRIIEEYGVVSSEVAASMAENVRKLTGSDYSVSTTGFAGPGGGDERFPEGTVWVGVSSKHGTKTKKFEYHHDRRRNIERFAASALHFLLCTASNEIKL